MKSVVLFDLDGTVLTYEGGAPGPGRTALDAAMRDLYALEGATLGLRVAGGTDRGLARSLLSRAGIEGDEEAIDRVLASYLAHLAKVVERRCYRPVGDVAGAVSALTMCGAIVGIATGNVREGARIKLGSAGLSATFDLALGGFGCDAEPRADILRAALRRCAAAGATSVVVVGDTEHDVRAGRAVGARVVGVATDDESRAELEAAGADAIVGTCGEELVARVTSMMAT
jgi:phosphoglycolate phosphatase-like HAD superfamily hydrolase